MLPLTRGSKRQDFDREAKGHVLDSATLMGKFAHRNSGTENSLSI